MMSVPAINPVLPPSGSQPPKVGSSPNAGSVSPLGLSVPQKVSVIPPQVTSPSKPPLAAVNHSSIPLSLVHENKISAVQAQTSVAKPADKPKDLSPTKPTSNGVETAAKSSNQPQQGQSGVNLSKPEDKPPEQPATNHSDGTKPAIPVNEAAHASQTPQPVQSPQTAQAPQDSKQNLPSDNAPSKVEQSLNQPPSEPNSEMKVNTDVTPNSESGTEVKPVKSDVKATSGPNKRKKEQKADEKKSDESVPEKKPQRIRSQVLPYQSPLPELATFINKSLKEKDASQKNADEKLIVFYKNEFLAVRNAENGFYLCQTLQNVYRTSHRIRIRWLSQDKESSTVYTPDFYDLTDFECILTTVALEKLDKNKYKLPQIELDRTENILKRALDVEKGVSEKPSVTEEHPDGIDLSLYKDESQLQKPKKRKSTSPAKRSPKQAKKADKSDSNDEGAEAAEEEKKKSKSRSKTEKKSSKVAKAKPKNRKKGKSESGGNREKSTKNVDQLKVSPPNEKARVVAKVLRKVEMTVTTSKKSKSKGKGTKSSSKKSEKKNSKSEKGTTSRSTERRVTTATSRKKPGKK